MRFVLDNDVDSAVRGALIQVGHDAWTAAEAGLAQADDDDLTVYAAQRSAIVVTHDNEFSDRRIKNGIHGKHVWLRCLEFDAARVLVRDLPNVAAVLSSPRDVLVELHLNSPPKIHRGVRKAR